MVELHIHEKHRLTPKEHRTEMRRIGRHHPLFDPGLSPKGQAQAKALVRVVDAERAKGIPLPKHFVSPAKRAVETWEAVWGGAGLARPAGATAVEVSSQAGPGHSFLVEVYQWSMLTSKSLREKLHVHLCNARRARSLLKAEHPRLICPSQMPESDPWWQPGLDCRYDLSDTQPPAELMRRETRDRETEEEMYVRAGKALGEIMRDSISITSHSSLLNKFIKVLRSPSRELSEGEIFPVVVRVETMS
ncbi:uncharacterized protein MKK02DRAFT_42093 [Dioszegia hungarica]|uniref:Uncharacterized protein n=1 Tax=Dioszegia hungarica TaxID=4972 RepID=A0AA38HFF6_9TREE|nr:uncharacterized protein MKK02DRAFT_42093 [Dioszegia hungarica]KAI9639052.1 hypothetical protein MKK02DRAFT_42093 [Dioszegia hungarica]